MRNDTKNPQPLASPAVPLIDPSNPPLEKLILCLWLPSWPIQRLVAANDVLRRTPIVLYRNQPGRGQVVTSVSPAAQLSGAAIGMPLSEAKSLVGRQRRFGPYHIFEHDPAADSKALHALAIDCARSRPSASSIGTLPNGLRAV